jgi:DNA-binding CsgD family transcriptional regulator
VRPLIVVEGGDAPLADALADLGARGLRLVDGWSGPAAGVVWEGVVADAADAASAVLAAVAGAGVVVDGRGSREILDRLCDDLRRLGPLDHRTADEPRAPRLTREQAELVALLAAGHTLGESARRLNLSRRTADRRLAETRALLGVETTAEAVVQLTRQRGRMAQLHDEDPPPAA